MIELSSEARRAYEVMVSSLEQSGQPDTELEANAEELEKNSLAEEPIPGPNASEEPEYSKLVFCLHVHTGGDTSSFCRLVIKGKMLFLVLPIQVFYFREEKL